MLSKNIAIALLTTALMTGVASAQSTTNKSDTAMSPKCIEKVNGGQQN
jgi:hypothetical protein